MSKKETTTLKEAILEAKQIRDVALANAEMTLREAFKPQLQSMLSNKLRQEVEELGDEMPEDQIEMPEQEHVDVNDQDFSIDTDTEELPEQEDDAIDIDLDTEELPEQEEEFDVNFDSEETPEEFDADTDVEELPEQEEEFDVNFDTEELPEQEDSDIDDELRQIEQELDSVDTDDVEDLDIDALPEQEDEIELDTDVEELPEQEDEINFDDLEVIDEPLPEQEDTEDFDLDTEELPEQEEFELDIDDEEVPEDIDEAHGDPIDVEKELAGAKTLKFRTLTLENKRLRKTLAQAMAVVKFQKGKINEVSLLNAKLLYANKLFKAYNLTEAQKRKVIDTIDLAANLRETKLVFMTLAESYKNINKKIVPKSRISQVTKLTEGLASRSTRTTKAPILNEDRIAKRFQEIANIDKK